MKKISLLAFVLIGLFACKQKAGKEQKTESGFKYLIYTKSKGPKVKIGDYVTLVMVYKNDKDSILFDSRNGSLPLRFQLDKIPFQGSFEDGLLNLAKDDSATFFVPADSLFSYLFKGKSGMVVSQEQTGFIPKSMVKFDIKVLNIQSAQEAEEEIVLKMSAQEKQEQSELNKYIYDKKITEKATADGYYLIMREQGKGEAIDSGKIVTVEYEGRFLNGEIFDGTKKSGKPYSFVSGAHHVIKSWELAMKDLHGGDKVTIISPSILAYGEEGIRNPKNGTFIVPPYKSLVFDIHILSAEDVPAVSGR